MGEQPVVVALGGNAISPPGSRSPIPAQYERTMETAEHLVHLAERPLVVTHGNGPQVGNLLLRSDPAAHLPPAPASSPPAACCPRSRPPSASWPGAAGAR